MGTDLGTPGALPALFHDAAAPPVAAELDWYAARLPRHAGGVLDLACGAGRLLVPLARPGRAMHGVERSAAALACCSARLAAEHLGATLVRQGLGELNLPFRFSAAYASAGSFQTLLDAAAASAALRRIRAHLIAPAVLILELFVPAESTQRIAAPLVELRTATLADGTRIAVRSETVMHAEARIARTQHRYVHRRGTTRLAEETESTAITWYSREDIVALLQTQGFERVKIEACATPREGVDAFAVIAHLE